MKWIFLVLISVSCGSIKNKQYLNKSESVLISQRDSLINNTDTNNYKSVIESSSVDTFSLGDINSDKIPDTAFIYTAPLIKVINIKDKSDFHYESCVNDSCFIRIKFSCNLPTLTHYSAIKGIVINVGDLNGDGLNEIMYAPDWFSSCWQGIFIYSSRNGKWSILGQGNVYQCADNVGYESRIKKINNKEFYLTSDEFDQDGITMKKKKNKIIIK